MLYMHTDQRIADIKTGVGNNSFDYNGTGETAHGLGCQRAASLGDGNNCHFTKTVFFRSAAFHNKRAVQMFAALDSQFNLLSGTNVKQHT